MSAADFMNSFSSNFFDDMNLAAVNHLGMQATPEITGLMNPVQ